MFIVPVQHSIKFIRLRCQRTHIETSFFSSVMYVPMIVGQTLF